MVRALAVPRIMHKYDLVLAPGAGRLLRHFYLYALALSNRDASSGPLRSWRPRSAACFVVYNTRYRRQRYESLSFNAGSDPRVCPRATRVTRHVGYWGSLVIEPLANLDVLPGGKAFVTYLLT